MCSAAEVPHAPTAVAALGQRSSSHSPAPYLLGSLAAMLGLIAFALLVLACSFRKRPGNHDPTGERDVEANPDEKPEPLPEFQDKIVVIMTGQVKPTFLATPVSFS